MNKSFELYCQILGQIARTQKPAKKIAADIGRSRNAVMQVLRGLRGSGCYIQSFRQHSKKGPPSAFWRFGCKPDAVHPESAWNLGNSSEPRCSAMVAFSVALDAMANHPCTVRDLIAETGLNRATINRVIRACRANGLIHVGAWERKGSSGPWAAAYSLGASSDAERPAAVPRAILQQTYDRKRTERDRQMRMLAAMNSSIFAEAA